jgi:ketosteroid isomerase-like protein
VSLEHIALVYRTRGAAFEVVFGGMSVGPIEVLDAHVRRFNDAVCSGDFSEMVQGFTADAEMVFEGVPVGPFVGRDAIAEAYTRQPPSDEVRLLGTPRVEGESVDSDYAWSADGRRAGRMIVTVRDGAIARLVITFE